MKNLDEIWDQAQTGFLCKTCFNDLKCHIDRDADPDEAIILATDLGLKILGPSIAKYLHHEKYFTRLITIECLLRLKLVQYADKIFQIILEDEKERVRNIAIFNIGLVLKLIKDECLQYSIAEHVYKIIKENMYASNSEISKELWKTAAYNCILESMEIPNAAQPLVKNMHKEIDYDLVERFKKNFKIK